MECVYWGPNNNQIKYLENPPATNIFLLTFCFKYIYIYQGFFYKKLQRGQNLLEYVHWHPNDNQIKNLKNPPATNILFLMFSIYMYRRRNKIINFSYVISTHSLFLSLFVLGRDKYSLCLSLTLTPILSLSLSISPFFNYAINHSILRPLGCKYHGNYFI